MSWFIDSFKVLLIGGGILSAIVLVILLEISPFIALALVLKYLFF